MFTPRLPAREEIEALAKETGLPRVVMRRGKVPGLVEVKAGRVARPWAPLFATPSACQRPSMRMATVSRLLAGTPRTPTRTTSPTSAFACGAALRVVATAPLAGTGTVTATTSPRTRLTGPATGRSTRRGTRTGETVGAGVGVAVGVGTGVGESEGAGAGVGRTSRGRCAAGGDPEIHRTDTAYSATADTTSSRRGAVVGRATAATTSGIPGQRAGDARRDTGAAGSAISALPGEVHTDGPGPTLATAASRTVVVRCSACAARATGTAIASHDERPDNRRALAASRTASGACDHRRCRGVRHLALPTTGSHSDSGVVCWELIGTTDACRTTTTYRDGERARGSDSGCRLHHLTATTTATATAVEDAASTASTATDDEEVERGDAGRDGEVTGRRCDDDIGGEGTRHATGRGRARARRRCRAARRCRCRRQTPADEGGGDEDGRGQGAESGTKWAAHPCMMRSRVQPANESRRNRAKVGA